MSKKKIIKAILLALSVLLTAAQNTDKTQKIADIPEIDPEMYME